MNNDLISRQALLKDMKRYCDGNCKRCADYTILSSDHHCGVIDQQPTVYDVDAVIKELFHTAQSIYGTNIIRMEDAVEIVKRGGRNE